MVIPVRPTLRRVVLAPHLPRARRSHGVVLSHSSFCQTNAWWVWLELGGGVGVVLDISSLRAYYLLFYEHAHTNKMRSLRFAVSHPL